MGFSTVEALGFSKCPLSKREGEEEGRGGGEGGGGEEGWRVSLLTS